MYLFYGKCVNVVESLDDEDEDSGDVMDDIYDVDVIDAGGEDLGGDDDEFDFDGEDDMLDVVSDISEEDEVLVMGGEGVGEEEVVEVEVVWI